MAASDKELRYQLWLEEEAARRTLMVLEDPEGTVVPERLIKALNKAQEALIAAEEDIARWVKHTDKEAAVRLAPMIDSLKPQERKKR